MIDYIQEIFSTLKQNRLRAIMTGFSVAWGIFMLILLLGSGKGLQNGMEKNFSGTSKNALWINKGRTQIAYDGLKSGRMVQYTNEDIEAIALNFPKDLENISGRFYTEYNTSITYKNEFLSQTAEAVMPEFNKIQMVEQLKGRYINDKDVNEYRKVAVLSMPVQRALFKDEDPIGKYIRVNNIPFMVVGVIDYTADTETKKVYVPLTTAQRVFNGSNKLGDLALATNALTADENLRIEEGIRQLLMKRHHVAPEDEQAIRIWNTLQTFSQAQSLFAAIRLFIWIVGIMTIIAGIVGVSNIMIILVKERTKEIGIRKALGATPWSIIRLVLAESVVITTLSGFMGMVTGMALLAAVSSALKQAGGSVERAFNNPSASLDIGLAALGILVISGLIAGYIPARKAADIRPIVALHDE